MRKFPKLRYPNDPETDGLHNGEVIVTEKLDGANFRFTWDPDADTLVIGTRNKVYRRGNGEMPTEFEHAVEYVEQCIEESPKPWEVVFKSGTTTLFGEAMHLHSLAYENVDWETPSSGSPHVPVESDTPNVVLFDAHREDGWVPWDTFKEFIAETPFEHAPVLERGNLSAESADSGENLSGDKSDTPDELSFDVPEESMFGGPPEGIVARRVDGTVRAKKVTEEFKETNAVAFEEPSKAQSDAAEFVAAYVTEARILNIAHSLVDEGQYDDLQMDMMADLPREVLRDAMAENGWDLLTSGGFEGEWDDDFKGEVRSKASKKCARALKAELQSF